MGTPALPGQNLDNKKYSKAEKTDFLGTYKDYICGKVAHLFRNKSPDIGHQLIQFYFCLSGSLTLFDIEVLEVKVCVQDKTPHGDVTRQYSRHGAL